MKLKNPARLRVWLVTLFALVHTPAFSEPPVAVSRTESSHVPQAVVMAVTFLAQPEATASQAPVDLRSTSRFAILAGSEITSVPTLAFSASPQTFTDTTASAESKRFYRAYYP